MTRFTQTIHEALDYAAIKHQGQNRKDPDLVIPYISHLFGVAYILAEHAFPEEIVVAGVLHDFLEDVVQRYIRPDLEEEMRQKFGNDVYALVSYVTQQKKDANGQKIDWHTRGEAYRAKLCTPTTPPGAKAISCADKIHNIESLLMALQRHKGRENVMWDALNGPPKEQVNKFKALHECLGEGWQHPILDRFSEMISRLKAVIPQERNA